MSIVTRTTAKSFFETGDKPTQAQFGDFIDSALFQEDFSSLGKALVSASTTASAQNILGGGATGKSLFGASTAAQARGILGSGAVGDNLFQAITTAYAQEQIGGGAVGIKSLEASTTASAQTNIGGGVVGRQVFEAATTASAQTNIGGGTVGRQIFEASTTAAAQNIILSNSVVQIVNTQTGAVATGTTTIPADDTIPQNTEGDEYMTLAITPTNASNKLLIEVCFQGSNSAANNTQVVALFQDSTANALTSGQMTLTAANNMRQCLTYYMTAGTTSATTFKVRAGGVSAGTTTFNGSASARLYGGVFNSSITITEIRV
jgi:hypothetical protein